MRSAIPLLFFFALLSYGCDQPTCTNTNPLFDTTGPADKVYKDELVAALKSEDPDGLRFAFNAFIERGNENYILVDVIGDSLCAKAEIKVVQPDDALSDIIETKGLGYRGAELIDLKFDIRRDSANTEFIFKSVGRIID